MLGYPSDRRFLVQLQGDFERINRVSGKELMLDLDVTLPLMLADPVEAPTTLRLVLPARGNWLRPRP
jgi:hypothetical protein